MKTFTGYIAACLTALFLTSTVFATGPIKSEEIIVPEGYTVSNNWLNTWQKTMGNSCAAWMLNEAADVDYVLEAKNGTGFILVNMDSENMNLDEFGEEYESGIVDGKGTRLHSPTGIKVTHTSSTIDFSGTISGKQANMRKVMLASENGNHIVLSHINPAHPYSPLYISTAQVEVSFGVNTQATVFTQ